jgi:integrase/recombinase XerD
MSFRRVPASADLSISRNRWSAPGHTYVPRRGRRRGMPLVRTPRTLPRVLAPAEVNGLVEAVRRWRDRAMLEAMVLGGLRACEVIGLHRSDLRPVERPLTSRSCSG